MSGGFIYLISNHDAYPGWYKLGRTSDIEKRLRQYRARMPAPYANCWEIEGLWRVSNPVAAEAYVLRRVRQWRFTLDKNEWFKGSTQDGYRLHQFIGSLLAERFEGVVVPELEEAA
jgi:hypothetical protein